MIDETDKLLARPLDAAFTIPVLKRARTVFYLTEREHTDLQSVVGDSRVNLVELNNGIPPEPKTSSHGQSTVATRPRSSTSHDYRQESDPPGLRRSRKRVVGQRTHGALFDSRTG